MKFLLFSGNNSLSHVVKCLAIRDALLHRGHKVLIAATGNYSAFLNLYNAEHEIVPDIQESDNAPFPTINWFKKPEFIIDCINAEIELIRKYKPDKILGVFRFTSKAAAYVADVPYLSLICGCLLPEVDEILGFMDGETGIEEQSDNLNYFNRYLISKMNTALKEYNIEPLNKIQDVFKGERTLLWDFQEFFPVPVKGDIIHTGPIAWDSWPDIDTGISALMKNGKPLAVISFGTCINPGYTYKRLAAILLGLDFNVILLTGDHIKSIDSSFTGKDIISLPRAPLNIILPHASILISHGGQMTVFEAMKFRVPSLVMPFQPEQAHNGVCLERVKCGRRLIPSRVFRGDSQVYIEAIEKMSDEEIKIKIMSIIDNPEITARLVAFSVILGKFDGARRIADHLEG